MPGGNNEIDQVAQAGNERRAAQNSNKKTADNTKKNAPKIG